MPSALTRRAPGSLGGTRAATSLPVETARRNLLIRAAGALKGRFAAPISAFVEKLFPRVARKRYWDSRAADLHAAWGSETTDYATIAACVETAAARSVIDVGCGSGRLFPLYRELRLEFVGCDLSTAALELARSRDGAADVRPIPVGEFSAERFGRSFDLAISNRALMCIPPAEIGRALAAIASVAPSIYLNEPLPGELPADVAHYLWGHDYDALLSALDYQRLSGGQILNSTGHSQTWGLYRRR